MLSLSPSQQDSPHHSSNPLTYLIHNILSYDGNIMLAAIISLLLVILFVLLLHVYAKWFLAQARHRRTRSSVSVSHVLGQSRFHHFHPFTVETNSTQKGLDPSVIASIPLYVHRVSKEHKSGLECVICLSLFEDGDVGRKLPNCGHVFHVECIDMWLHSHSSCPICRASVVVENRVSDCDSIRNDVNYSSEREHESELWDGLDIVVEAQNCENENESERELISGEIALEIQNSENENLATNGSVSGCSSSSSLSRASSLSGSLKRIMSRNKSERKIHPSTIVNEALEVV